MGMMSPAFRELNYHNVFQMAKTHTHSTIALIITEKTGVQITEHDVTSYLKMNGLASNVMLVEKSVLEYLGVTSPKQAKPKSA